MGKGAGRGRVVILLNLPSIDPASASGAREDCDDAVLRTVQLPRS